MLKVRNSAKGQHLFGQDQQGEHEVECMVTRNNNSCNLAAEDCIYIQIPPNAFILKSVQK